ncbi:MAG: methylenetetrahydrofolate reductase, partial [Pseudomonadota bacterium]
ITSECFLRPETDAEAMRLQADLLRDHVDGVLLTDNQYGGLHMSTVAAARLMLDNGIDPIVQLSCRNRNRLSLIADMLGAAALGVTSLLLVRGNRVPKGIKPRPKAVLDVNAAELIQIATNLQSEDRLENVPEMLVGGMITPHEPKADWAAEKIKAKADSGALFMVTYICMDLELLKRYMKRLVAEKLTRRMSVIVSIAILTSADDARYLRDNRPNMLIPDALIDRLEAASDPQAEGLAICSEQLQELKEIPGVSGANIIASTDLSMIPVAIAAAGIRS